MRALHTQFVEGPSDSARSVTQPNNLFQMITKFAGYGFNKSHAAAYALLTYRTAYLKSSQSAGFMTALMTSDFGDHEQISLCQ